MFHETANSMRWTIGIEDDKPFVCRTIFNPESGLVGSESGLKAAGLRVIEFFAACFRVMNDLLQVFVQDTPFF